MKKGIIFTVIILIVAAVLTVVFVTLFKERDTDAVANKVISVVDEGYLSENSDKEALEDYLDYMSASEQNDEVTMSKTLLATYDKLGDFYREHIAFTSYNSTYKSNKGDIINGLDSASDSMDEMVSYINSHTAGGNSSWEARTWDDVRVMMFEFIEANNRAFSSLSYVYIACENSQIVNNDYTSEVLKAISEHLSSYGSLDMKGRLTMAENVSRMATNYLKTELVYGYLYDDIWQAQIEDIMTNGTDSSYYSSFVAGTL